MPCNKINVFPLPQYLTVLFYFTLKRQSGMIKNKRKPGAETDPRVHFKHRLHEEANRSGLFTALLGVVLQGRHTDGTHPSPYPAATFGNTWSPSSRWAERAPA